MTKPTQSQINFLNQQKIPLYQLFDATGLKFTEYKQIMKDLGMVVAVGVTPCNEAGHTLRDRHGHCVQCGTHNFAFRRRHYDSGVIYLARSESLQLSKVGTTKDASGREKSLNRFGYGGSCDWKIQYSKQCDEAGRVEFNVHQALKNHNVSKSYWKQGRLIDCAELFNCGVELAIETIENIISQY